MTSLSLSAELSRAELEYLIDFQRCCLKESEPIELLRKLQVILKYESAALFLKVEDLSKSDIVGLNLPDDWIKSYVADYQYTDPALAFARVYSHGFRFDDARCLFDNSNTFDKDEFITRYGLKNEVALGSGTTNGFCLFVFGVELHKQPDVSHILEFLRDHLEMAILKLSNRTLAAASRFTTREQSILECLISGMGTREMAATLYRSERTIKLNLTELYRKLGVTNRSQAIAYAVRHRRHQED